MTDSFTQSLIPLGSDTKLRDRYLNNFGDMRVGRLLEDMDMFVGILVYKHILNPNQEKDDPRSPFSMVTALVDRIDIKVRHYK